MVGKLTVKEELFCQEFLKTLNGARAAEAAGCAAKSARVRASEMLRKSTVQDRLAELFEARSKRTGIEAEDILREWCRVAMFDPRELFTWGPTGVEIKDSAELTPEQARMVTAVKMTKTKAGDKVVNVEFEGREAARVNVAKHLGMFIERHSVENLTIDTKDLTMDQLSRLRAGEPLASVLSRKPR